ncbi:MAG: efflux RND transporter periplasmic adaptor subunit [Desulfarculaceae bacterium]|jgi:RND family efflux transporter MFP subunit
MKSKKLRIVTVLGGVLALAVLILYSGGFLDTGKIEPGREAAAVSAAPKGIKQVKALVDVLPDFYEAVGTVRPRTEAKVEAQTRARVLKVAVRPGDRVEPGQLLVLLDAKEHSARLGQARQDLKAAKAALDLAESEFGRLSRLFERGAAPKRDLDRVREARQQATASFRRVQKQVEESEVAISYTRITASEKGQVAKRFVDPGDLALPGKPLLILQTGGGLRLEALVREGLIHKVRMGQTLGVLIPAWGKEIQAKVDEIAPSADPQTRTFVVKAVLPAQPGLYSGMFGRLLIPVGKQKVVLAPPEAIKRVGQLEMVLLKKGDAWQQVYVTTGRLIGGKVEVLSGLDGGEILGVE